MKIKVPKEKLLLEAGGKKFVMLKNKVLCYYCGYDQAIEFHAKEDHMTMYEGHYNNCKQGEK